MITVTQLSDLHVSPPGFRGYGGLAPDTAESFAAAATHAFDGATRTELAVVTGDIADHGAAEEYEIAAERLAAIPVPTSILPGNHDFHAPFHGRLAGASVSTSRAERHGPWLFLFLDSNADGRTLDDLGRLVDNDDRIMASGSLGAAEVAWADELIGASDAEHVWLWVHHAPGASGAFDKPDFTAEFEGLVARHPHIRGIGAGHTHTNEQPTVASRPVHICPSLTLNFDVQEWTTLPPGYRTYSFADDGTVHSDLHLLDDERWPRIPLPEPVVQFFKAEIGWDEMQAAVGLDLSH
ncbi:MAG: metallophosphoesterase [Actinomycetota bacterium]